MDPRDATAAPRNLTCVTHLPAHHTRLYIRLCCLCAIDSVLLGALVDYYGNATRCNWDYGFRSSVKRFQSLWRLLERQSEDNRNPYHLVVALYAAKYRADDSICNEAEVLARAIAALIVPGVRPPECVGPDGIRVLADGTIHDPESLSESRDVRLLEDIEDNHWRLYGALRRACNANKETLDRVKQYYGRPERMGWHAENQASLKTFDSVWGILTSAVMETRNPRYLVKALTMESSAAPKSEPSEVVGGLINDIIATDVVMPDDL